MALLAPAKTEWPDTDAQSYGNAHVDTSRAVTRPGGNRGLGMKPDRTYQAHGDTDRRITSAETNAMPSHARSIPAYFLLLQFVKR